MQRSIHDVTKLTGITSRTLRHYDAIGLLAPTSTGPGGERRYDEDALARLQRILLLRELGMGLAAVAEVLAHGMSEEDALAEHVAALRDERARLDRQIAAVERTMKARKEGRPIMAEEMFDGFDHTEHEAEVTQRWGAAAYARGDVWWRGLSADDRASWRARTEALARDWVAAAESGCSPESAEARRLAERHIAWLTGVPGTPASDPGGDTDAYVRGLADMYVADPRFARRYAVDAGGTAGAEFVRDALNAYLDARR